MTGPSLALPGDLLSFSCNSDEVKFESELSEVFQNMKYLVHSRIRNQDVFMCRLTHRLTL